MGTLVHLRPISFICILTACLQPTTANVNVGTSSGVVEGISAETKWGSVIHFYGIPYAKTPARFQNSKPLIPLWSDEPLNDASNEHHHHYDPLVVQAKAQVGSDSSSSSPPSTTTTISKIINLPAFTAGSSSAAAACPQPSHLTDFQHPSLPHAGESVDEDCLKLNIYMPAGAALSGARRPILAWIPGDGFSFGDAIHYDGSALTARGNMLVVTVNYRVGVFGFLSLDEQGVPGNAGLSDIISALEWIHENGAEFNGDVTNITLAGRFSGSMAISALVTSPTFLRNKNRAYPTLAHRVILHGGIASSPWVIETNPIEPVLKLIGFTNCSKTGPNLAESLKCLQNLPVQTLLHMSMKVPEMFRPVVDNHIILVDPMEAMSLGLFPENVQFLIGSNSGSGSICYQRHVYTKGDLLRKIQDDTLNEADLRSLVQDDLITYFNVHDEALALASLVAHEYLYSTISSSKSLRSVYTNFCGSLFLRNPTELTARHIARFGRNLVYRYELDGQFETESAAATSTIPKWLETTIGNEIIFLFPTKDHNMTAAEKIIFRDLTAAYVSFVWNGNPGKLWPVFDEVTKDSFVFRPEGMQTAPTTYLDQDVHFWNDTFPLLLNSLKKASSNSSSSDQINAINHRPIVVQNDPCVESIEHHHSSTKTATDYFLGFFIFLGSCCLFGMGVFIFQLWRKHRIMFR